MNQILPNLRIAFFCTFIFVAAALSPILFTQGKTLPQARPAVWREGLEILAFKR